LCTTLITTCHIPRPPPPHTHTPVPARTETPSPLRPVPAELEALGPSERVTEEASLAELLIPMGLAIKEIRVSRTASA
jgi:hypothetical protein